MTPQRFQLSRSKLLLLTILARVFIGAQFWTRSVPDAHGFTTDWQSRGFPFRYEEWFDKYGVYRNVGPNPYALVLNGMTGIAWLGVLGYGVEHWIRRRHERTRGAGSTTGSAHEDNRGGA